MSDIPQTITLPDGHVLTLRELDPGDQLDLIEAAGSAMNSGAAAAWLGYAQMIASVSEIDGVPVQLPVTKDEIKALARRIGNAGILAVQRALYPSGKENVAAEETATAKN